MSSSRAQGGVRSHLAGEAWTPRRHSSLATVGYTLLRAARAPAGLERDEGRSAARPGVGPRAGERSEPP
ncbi:hypothetical protein SHIRM173S_08214 [Streptomyces hirsutus]